MKIRDRIKAFKRVKASALKPSPFNWRTHPDGQRAALAEVLSEIGYADALLARQLEDGSLELIDGHLRAETTPDGKVPVLILDVTEEEARKLVAVLDPLGAMAGADPGKLDELLRDLGPSSEALQTLLANMAANNGLSGEPNAQAEAPGEFPSVDEDLPTAYRCPKCGYEWSGQPQ